MKQSAALYSVRTVKEASIYLGVSDRRVRQLCATGKLVARRSDSGWIIDYFSLQKFLVQREAKNHDGDN